MEKLARSAIKIILFSGLFFLSVRYVHTYPLPMPARHQYYLRVISEFFGVRDYEFFYIASMVIVDLIVTVVVYSIMIRLCRRYRAKH